jgi:hypothetical protein
MPLAGVSPPLTLAAALSGPNPTAPGRKAPASTSPAAGAPGRPAPPGKGAPGKTKGDTLNKISKNAECQEPFFTLKRLLTLYILALQENLQAIANRTVPAVRTNIQGGRAVADATQGLQGQLNLPRFRFIDQVPGGRAAIDAILREFPNLTFPH